MYEELVKKLRNRRICVQVGGNLEQEYPLMREAADAIEELQQTAGHYEEAARAYFRDVCYYLERMPKWIPVTERLPESMHEYVLCCGEKGGQFVGWVGEGVIVNGKTRAFQHDGRGRHITHWMPLPQPPKEET